MLSDGSRRHTWQVTFLLLCLGTALLLAPRLIELPLHVARDYNEGWNALQAERAFRGEALYPPYGGLTGNNYPPVSFYVVGGLGRIIGDNIVAGRLIAFLCLLVVAANIAVIVRRLGGSQRGAWVSAVFFLGFVAAHNALYVAMNDPQWLGHAVMTSGLAVFLSANQRGVRFYIAVLLIVAAGFVKHMLIPIPLAVALWLLLHDRHAFIRYCAPPRSPLFCSWPYSSGCMATAFCAASSSIPGSITVSGSCCV